MLYRATIVFWQGTLVLPALFVLAFVDHERCFSTRFCVDKYLGCLLFVIL